MKLPTYTAHLPSINTFPDSQAQAEARVWQTLRALAHIRDSHDEFARIFEDADTIPLNPVRPLRR